jgi:hypothetical protein
MSNEQPPRAAPAVAMAAVFWALLAAFVVLDWTRAPQRNRFDEPPPFAVGSGPAKAGAHCAAAPTVPQR